MAKINVLLELEADSIPADSDGLRSSFRLLQRQVLAAPFCILLPCSFPKRSSWDPASQNQDKLGQELGEAAQGLGQAGPEHL